MQDKFKSKIYECDTKVIHNHIINNDYRHLILSAPRKALDIIPGQFFHLQCPPSESSISYLRRPMSVYQFNQIEGKIEFLYKIHGKGTKAMSSLREGDIFNILGPLGIGFTIEDNWKNLVLVARGVGLATLAPLAKFAMEKGKKLTAICSARSPEHLMSLDLFRSFGVKIITVTDNDGSSSVPKLKALINNLLLEQSIDAFFTCGSNRILKLLKMICIKNKIAGQIALEQQMACGIGMCFCCVRAFEVKGKILHRRVCNEGPVFNLLEAMPW